MGNGVNSAKQRRSGLDNENQVQASEYMRTLFTILSWVWTISSAYEPILKVVPGSGMSSKCSITRPFSVRGPSSGKVTGTVYLLLGAAAALTGGRH